MQQITKELPNGTILFVEVKTYEPHSYDLTDSEDGRKIFSVVGVDGVPSFCYLPKGNWQLLGDSKYLTEEQLKEIMPMELIEVTSVTNEYGNDYYAYVNPLDEENAYSTAIESYKSLKESLGVVDECNCSDGDSFNCYKCLKLKSYQVLYKKN